MVGRPPAYTRRLGPVPIANVIRPMGNVPDMGFMHCATGIWE